MRAGLRHTDTGGLVDEGGSPLDADAQPPSSTVLPRPAPPDEPGSISVLVDTDCTRIVLFGEIDIDLGADLTAAVEDARAAGLPVEVHAGGVTFVDSTGLAFLARLSLRSPGPVTLVNPPERLLWLIGVAMMDDHFDVVERRP